MEKIIEILSRISLVFLIAVVISLVVGLPTWILWNWLMPVIFGLPKITFWQAVGLTLLSSILFKSSNTIKQNN